MLELYHWRPVSHSAKVLICLAEVGAEYKGHYVDLLAFEQFDDAFLALNAAGQVPVLKVGDVAMTESSLINEYLAESFPEAGIAPTGSYGWYECQAWSKYVDYNLGSSIGTLGCRKFLVPYLAERKRVELAAAVAAIPVEERRAGWSDAVRNAYSDDVLANSRRKIGLVVERANRILAVSEWLVGDAYSIADINTFAMLNTAAAIEPELVRGDHLPNLGRWFDAIAIRPAVRLALSGDDDGQGFAPGPEHSRWG
jgi:glutathione S-transferase